MNFDELGLTKRICAVLEKLEFTTPTEIQSKAIPVITAGKDVMASAETGSGKTAAYALPIIQNLKGSSERKPRCLVLVPTRELALQVQTQFERFSNNSGMRTVTVYGGTGYEKQTRLLRRGVDVIVATPGRLSDHVERGNADLSNISMLVLDEADRMLDMGFLPQVRAIVDEMDKPRQTMMFSATISKNVEKIASEFLTSPVTVQVNTSRVEPTSIEQRIYHIEESGKEALLVQLIKDEPELVSVLVFTQTRRKAAKVAKKLCASDVTAEEIHGDISQSQREKTLARYREGRFAVLVATDIAARGLDIPAISHVVNYDLPMSPADYVHRIGRTGRAGRSGIALSFVSADQRHLMRDIERITGRPLDPNGPKDDDYSRSGGKRRSQRSGSARGGARRPAARAGAAGDGFARDRKRTELDSKPQLRDAQGEVRTESAPRFKRESNSEYQPRFKRNNDAETTPRFKREGSSEGSPRFKREGNSESSPRFKREGSSEGSPRFKREGSSEGSPRFKREDSSESTPRFRREGSDDAPRYRSDNNDSSPRFKRTSADGKPSYGGNGSSRSKTSGSTQGKPKHERAARFGDKKSSGFSAASARHRGQDSRRSSSAVR